MTVKGCEDVDIELDVVREDPGAKSRYLTERKSSKKKVFKKSSPPGEGMK